MSAAVMEREQERAPRSRASIAAKIEEAFMVLNHELFGQRLPVPEIIFQPKARVLVRWVPDPNNIIIGSELADATVEDVLVGLLHEMVHLYNYFNGIVDCTSNAYHNLKFAAVALQVGLYVLRQKTVGWGITLSRMPTFRIDPSDIRVPDRDSKERCSVAFERIDLNAQVLKIAQDTIRATNRKASRNKVYFMKYQCQCPPPHNSIRSGRRPDGPNRLDILCKKCGRIFTCVNGCEENGSVPEPHAMVETI